MDKKKIWIDLDNSPHVPFFKPIVEELQRRGCSVMLTARDCFQVCGLADLSNMSYKRIGRHYGKNKFLKLTGLLLRTLQLAPVAMCEKPDLALSHGSRSQLLAAAILGIPSVAIFDYEHAKGLSIMHPDWVVVPAVIPDRFFKVDREHILGYPGFKEDVYVHGFRPEPGMRGMLGLGEEEVVATVRPPATEAHYHNPQSEILFKAAIEFLCGRQDARMVLLPRNDTQADMVRDTWPAWCDNGNIVIPEGVVDGLNLIWHSDLVISGGGTMNREAAALGVPVYSIFRGEIGAVDRYLSESGRLTLLESVEDVRTKISLSMRQRPDSPEPSNHPALKSIVDNIVTIMEGRV
jgi:predicted glycosyltransferase